MMGIVVGTAALIIVLSVFNGLEGLVKGFYQSFDPDLKVSLVQGKYHVPSESELTTIKEIEGLEAVAEVLEERVLLTFRSKEYIATIKGVSDNFTNVSDISGSLIGGDYFTANSTTPTLIIGAGVSYYLGYSTIDFESPISAFVPKEKSGIDFSSAFSSQLFYPSGIFSVEPEFDEKYTITHIDNVRKLLNRPLAISAYELKLKDGADEKQIKKQIKQVLGDTFSIQNRDEQQAVLFKVMKSENLFTFVVFALILGISTFTIMGSLSMLMLDKKENLYTLWTIGSDINSLQKIFFKEGMIIGVGGAILGLVLGLTIIFVQQQFGIITLAPGYAIDSYPVVLKFKDVLLVMVTVFCLSALASWLTSKRLSLKLIRSVS